MSTAVIISIISLLVSNLLVLVTFVYWFGSKITGISKDLEYTKKHIESDDVFRESTVKEIASLDKRVSILESA